jgi:hypothetical protein
MITFNIKTPALVRVPGRFCLKIRTSAGVSPFYAGILC